MENLNDYKAGDVLLVYTKMRYETEVRTARVFLVNWNNNGVVSCEGLWGGEFPPTGQFGFRLEEVGQKKFGIQKIEKIGFKPSASHWYPKPGDRGYDLMC